MSTKTKLNHSQSPKQSLKPPRKLDQPSGMDNIEWVEDAKRGIRFYRVRMRAGDGRHVATFTPTKFGNKPAALKAAKDYRDRLWKARETVRNQMLAEMGKAVAAVKPETKPKVKAAAQPKPGKAPARAKTATA